MAVQLVAKRKSIRDQVSAEEWAARVELAAGHRLLAHYGVNDMTYNHFGLRVPGQSGACRGGVPSSGDLGNRSHGNRVHVAVDRRYGFDHRTAGLVQQVDIDGIGRWNWG